GGAVVAYGTAAHRSASGRSTAQTVGAGTNADVARTTETAVIVAPPSVSTTNEDGAALPVDGARTRRTGAWHLIESPGRAATKARIISLRPPGSERKAPWAAAWVGAGVAVGSCRRKARSRLPYCRSASTKRGN